MYDIHDLNRLNYAGMQQNNRGQMNNAAYLEKARALFYRSLGLGKARVIGARIVNRSVRLCDLEDMPTEEINSRHYAGIQAVDLKHVRGSLGRTGDFDDRFHPLRERIRDRWVSIALARYRNIPLSAVELIQIGEIFFVQDGHHRISVARALGESCIDANIIAWEMVNPCSNIMINRVNDKGWLRYEFPELANVF